MALSRRVILPRASSPSEPGNSTLPGVRPDLVFTWIYRKAFANISREPENRVQKVLYGASLAGSLILLAEIKKFC